MSIRFFPSVLAVLGVLLAAAGAPGGAHVLLLAAVVAAAGTVLEAVADRVAARTTRAEVALTVGALGCVVAAATLRLPWLALGSLAVFVRVPAIPRAEPRAEPVLSK